MILGKHERERHARAVDDLATSLLALSLVTERDAAAQTICRVCSRMAHGLGALLYIEGPGRLDIVGRAGIHPPPADPEVGVEPRVEQVLRGGRILAGDPYLVPLIGTNGVAGVVSVTAPQRGLDAFDESLLTLLGVGAGTMFERFSTGIEPGDRQRATSAMAALRTGDAVVIVEVDADEAALERLGAHLRATVRPGDAVAALDDDAYLVVLRGLRGPAELIVNRITTVWTEQEPARPLRTGVTVHGYDRTPLDTVDDARAQARGRTQAPGGSS